MSFKIEMLTQP